jgi:hypothetical protein
MRGLIFPIERPSAGFIERLRFQYLDGALKRGWDVERDGDGWRDFGNPSEEISCLRSHKRMASTGGHLIPSAENSDPHRSPWGPLSLSAQSTDRAMTDVIRRRYVC